MKRYKLVAGECYHIFNRGNNKQIISYDEKDKVRLLFSILYFQSPFVFYNPGRYISHFVRHRMFNIPDRKIEGILSNRSVELLNFAIMPNHFHLAIKGISENGISSYMQRIQNSYTKYFNTKYGKSGHIFEGAYKMVHIENNEQLLHLSAYIHRNPREMKEWKNKEHLYPWSSYQDYTDKNRWGDILKNQIILEQFSNNDEYRDFIETSGVKSDLESDLEEKLIFE